MDSEKYDLVAREVGAWHHLLVQELRKKQSGENYHWKLVTAGLRHIQRYCSADAYRYYLDAYNGHNIHFSEKIV